MKTYVQGAINSLSVILNSIMFLFSFYIMNKYLPPNEFGFILLFFSVCASSLFFDLGFTQGLTRFIALANANTGYTRISAYFACQIILIITSIFVLCFFSLLHFFEVFELFENQNQAIDTDHYFYSGFCIFLTQLLVSTNSAYLKGIEKYHTNVIFGVILFFLTLPFTTVLLVYFGLNFSNAITIVAMSQLALFIIQTLNIVQREIHYTEITKINIIDGIKNVKKMFSFATANFLLNLNSLFTNVVLRMFVSNTIGLQALPTFQIAVWAPAKLASLTMAFSEPIFVRFTDPANVGKETKLYNKIIIKSTFLFIISLIALTVFLIFAEKIYFFLTSSPQEGLQLSIIFSVGLLINIFSQPMHYYLMAKNRAWLNFFASGVGTLLLASLMIFTYLFYDVTLYSTVLFLTISLSVSSFLTVIFASVLHKLVD